MLSVPKRIARWSGGHSGDIMEEHGRHFPRASGGKLRKTLAIQPVPLLRFEQSTSRAARSAVCAANSVQLPYLELKTGLILIYEPQNISINSCVL